MDLAQHYAEYSTCFTLLNAGYWCFWVSPQKIISLCTQDPAKYESGGSKEWISVLCHASCAPKLYFNFKMCP